MVLRITCLISIIVFMQECQGQTLTESESVVIKPGNNHKLTCTFSGIDVGAAYISWIRQAEGKALEWISYISAPSGSDKYYSKTVEGRFTISRDNSKMQVYLHMTNLQTEDTAVYYCARNTGIAFDYWGNGTKVTVSSAQPSAPKSIFAMSQCTPDSSGYVTVGCMTRGFSPADSLTFKWTDPDKKELSDVVQYPAFGLDGEHTKISHVRIRKSSLNPQKPYTCEASNSKGPLEVNIPKAKAKAPESSTLTLNPPDQREIFLNNEVILEAVVTGDMSLKLSCTINNAETKIVAFHTGNSQSVKKYNITVDTEKWFKGEKVTCTIGETNKITQEIIFNTGDGKHPNIFTYRPDSIGTGRVSLVCEISSTKLGDVYVMWKVGNGPYSEGRTFSPINQNDSTSVLSILKVSKEEYENPQTTITCAVFHANMNNARSPTQVATSKSVQPEPDTGFALDCNKDVLEEDEFSSLWSTATSFIFLFLFSLTYSAVLSFFKVKQ